MRCQEEEEGDHVPGLGTRMGSTQFDCYNKLNDLIIGSLVRDGSRIFNEIHSRGQILYGISSETSDSLSSCTHTHIRTQHTHRLRTCS